MSSLQVEFDEEIKSLKSNVDIAVSEKNNYRQIASDVTEQLKSTQRWEREYMYINMYYRLYYDTLLYTIKVYY